MRSTHSIADSQQLRYGVIKQAEQILSLIAAAHGEGQNYRRDVRMLTKPLGRLR